MQYLLNCDCGKELAVETRQAGQSVSCSCGKRLEVPTLRQLRLLPTAEPREKPIPGPANWSNVQRIAFVTGVTIAVIAAGVMVHFLRQRMRLEVTGPEPSVITSAQDIQSLTPAESWTLWQTLRVQKLGFRPLPGHIRVRLYAQERTLYSAIAGGVSLLGVLVAASSFLLRPAGKPP